LPIVLRTGIEPTILIGRNRDSLYLSEGRGVKGEGESNPMNSFYTLKGKKIHSRHIEVSTYECDGQRIIVEGFLKDDRFQDSHIPTGEKLPSGVVHHMSVRLLVNCSNLLIEDIDVDLIYVPREFCRETIDCLAPIKGMPISKGFTAKVKKLVGGEKGCAHLVELLLAMAPAAIQGYAAYRTKNPVNLDAERAKMQLHFLINTCHAWREDGPLAERFRKAFHEVPSVKSEKR
jgi:hypothetical protein